MRSPAPSPMETLQMSCHEKCQSLKCFSWWHIHLLLRKVDFITKWSQNFRNVSKPKKLGLREEPPELLEHNFSEIKALGCPGMGCAPWLHSGHTWRLSAPVCSCFFRYSAFPRGPGSPALLAKPEENRTPMQQCCWNPCPQTHCDVLEVYRKFQPRRIFHWHGVLPENLWPIALGDNLMHTRKSWSIFCVVADCPHHALELEQRLLCFLRISLLRFS